MTDEKKSLTHKERLQNLHKGDSYMLTRDENTQSVYSAIRENSDLFKKKKFSIRTHPTTLNKHVYRTK